MLKPLKQAFRCRSLSRMAPELRNTFNRGTKYRTLTDRKELIRRTGEHVTYSTSGHMACRTCCFNRRLSRTKVFKWDVHLLKLYHYNCEGNNTYLSRSQSSTAMVCKFFSSENNNLFRNPDSLKLSLM